MTIEVSIQRSGAWPTTGYRAVRERLYILNYSLAILLKLARTLSNMNFMKIRLSTVLWAITVACLAFGWFWERSQFQAKLDDQVETQVSVECSLTAALYKNLFSARLREVELGEKSEQEFEEFRRYSLVENIIYLYLNEKWATNRTTELGNGWTCLLYTSPSPRDRG